MIYEYVSAKDFHTNITLRTVVDRYDMKGFNVIKRFTPFLEMRIKINKERSSRGSENVSNFHHFN